MTLPSDEPRRQVPAPKSEHALTVKWQRKVMRQLRMLNRRVDDLESGEDRLSILTILQGGTAKSFQLCRFIGSLSVYSDIF